MNWLFEVTHGWFDSVFTYECIDSLYLHMTQNIFSWIIQFLLVNKSTAFVQSSVISTVPNKSQLSSGFFICRMDVYSIIYIINCDGGSEMASAMVMEFCFWIIRCGQKTFFTKVACTCIRPASHGDEGLHEICVGQVPTRLADRLLVFHSSVLKNHVEGMIGLLLLNVCRQYYGSAYGSECASVK